MVTDRFLVPEDLPILAVALAKDETHIGTEPEFFTEYGTVCKVYEDELGPIMFVRGTKALRLDIQYVSNDDKRRNLTAMLDGFDKLALNAKAHGFTEIVFNTSNDLLKKFCVRRFGFVDSQGELRKFL